MVSINTIGKGKNASLLSLCYNISWSMVSIRSIGTNTAIEDHVPPFVMML